MKTNLLSFMLAAGCLLSGSVCAGHEDDPHYTPAGFFDMHVCNWPENPRFLLALFSTRHFDDVAKVSVFAPDGKLFGNLDVNRFRAFKSQSGEAMRAFITHFDLPDKAVDGWYRAEINLKNGSHFEAQDCVIHYSMAQPTGIRPVPDASDVPASTDLRWDPIPGAKFYEVFLRDDFLDVEEVHVVNDWRYLGTSRSEAEIHELLEQTGQVRFDMDTYKLLKTQLGKGKVIVRRL